jgi:hypothetical protein
MNSILNTTKFNNPQTEETLTVPDHPLVWVFGDFNYRIDNEQGNWTSSEIQHKIADGRLKFLLRFDQLSRELRGDNLLLKKWGFVEGEIDFAPTYKYITGSHFYDSEENAIRAGKSQSTRKLVLGTVKKKKDRIPSWTDRVFFRASEYENLKILQSGYGRYESKLSDHKPVFGTFEVAFSEQQQNDVPARTTAPPPPVPKHLLDKKKSDDSPEELFTFDDVMDSIVTEVKQDRRKTTTMTLEGVTSLQTSYTT